MLNINIFYFCLIKRKDKGGMEVIVLPKKLVGITDYDEYDNWILKDGATEEQKKIFEEFKKGIESKELTDTIINFEE